MYVCVLEIGTQMLRPPHSINQSHLFIVVLLSTLLQISQIINHTLVVAPEKDKECQNGKRCPTVGPCDGDKCCDESEEESGWCEVDYWLGLGLVALMSATIISTPFWLWVTGKLGKNKTWLTFNLITALTNGLFVFVGEGEPKLVVLFAFFNGLPNGASFLTDSIVADVIDYDEFLTGSRSEGRFTIFQTFIPKV